MNLENISFNKFAIALFMLISVSFASTTLFGFKSDIDWVFIAYFVLLIIAILLGISFMVSKIFALQQLEVWVKEEFANLLISAAILVLFTSFIGMVESISSSIAKDVLSSSISNNQIQYWNYVPSSGRWQLISTSSPNCPYPCHIYIARGFLGSLYEKYGESLKSISQYYFVSVFYMTESMGTGFDFILGKFKFEMGFGYPVHADLTIYNNILATVVSEYLKIITAIKMQEVALVYLTSLAGLFFILGVISRSVWFLRKFGGLLLATGIGLYTIFPMMYVLSWYTIDRTAVSFTVDLPEIVPELEFSGISGGVQGLGNINLLFTTYDPATGKAVSIGMLDALGRAYLPIIAIPLLAIFTTIGFIRHFSPMIGGDIEIAGLTRII